MASYDPPAVLADTVLDGLTGVQDLIYPSQHSYIACVG